MAALLTVGVLGCGGSKRDPVGAVSGAVTFQGQPVSEGMVSFHNPQKGVFLNFTLKPDGTYVARTAQQEGLPVGAYKVAVLPPLADVPVGVPKEPLQVKEYPNIPPRYRKPDTSGLTLVVQQGENRFDIAMAP